MESKSKTVKLLEALVVFVIGVVNAILGGFIVRDGYNWFVCEAIRLGQQGLAYINFKEGLGLYIFASFFIFMLIMKLKKDDKNEDEPLVPALSSLVAYLIIWGAFFLVHLALK